MGAMSELCVITKNWCGDLAGSLEGFQWPWLITKLFLIFFFFLCIINRLLKEGLPVTVCLSPYESGRGWWDEESSCGTPLPRAWRSVESIWRGAQLNPGMTGKWVMDTKQQLQQHQPLLMFALWTKKPQKTPKPQRLGSTVTIPYFRKWSFSEQYHLLSCLIKLIKEHYHTLLM